MGIQKKKNYPCFYIFYIQKYHINAGEIIIYRINLEKISKFRIFLLSTLY